ncbi:methylated-DNA--[protein]-cysteine S-methyltransferase [Cypionkella sp.]|uniref:methylated-DNA--[protein]-cysteine S-methyltransferase n=1 Tax=Cypionkella sp. TaxID=2811411 RepID=UPI002779E540|nr:methylated-DNA--[protein]-cysteine S-methyltransferase [Cypionkella sp.]
MTDQSPSYHYALIARALRVLEAEGPALTLEALAARMGVSAAHFQRVFSAWVGVSPKRYQQYLLLDHARDLLARKFTLLDTALETGLSGPSRLHDLFMTWEAMTPGDVARGGAGLAIDWGWFDSPFGAAIVMGTEKGICGLGFAAEMGEAAAFADLQNRWPLAQFRENPAQLAPRVQTAFGLQRGANAPAPLLLIGAPFQIKVWQALLAIPSGHVTTYSEIARHIGHPKAVRAVGTAVGRNPISLLIPCHRALRKSGALGGYHWGLPVKRAMLAYEAARADAAE